MKDITKKLLDINKFESLTQVQEDVLKYLDSNRDLIVLAPTGTGKTHAFLLSILEKVDFSKASLQAIILSPTRELAMQTYDFAKKIYDVEQGVNIDLAIGGMDNSRLKTKLEKQPQILISTPGKMLDILTWNALRVDTLKLMIIDEMDMMFDYGFVDDINKIASSVLDSVQFMLLSATLPKGLDVFIKNYLHNPITIESKDEAFAPKIEHILIHRRHKSIEESVLDVLTKINPSVAIVFANTKKQVADIAGYLQSYGVECVEIHGDLSDRERKQIITRIRNQHVRYIVATDLAARGIDLPEISHVINANIPGHDLSFYTHRAGRTGRTGRDGYCISLIDDHDQKDIVRLFKQGINFTFKRVQKNSIADTRPFIHLEKRQRGQLDPEIRAQLRRKNVKVKPGYKRKHKAQVEKAMQQKKRKFIQDDIRRQKKERAVERQRRLFDDED